MSSDSDLTLICPHLGDGGVQRVVSTLANAWNARGRKVTIITLYRHEVLYRVDPGVNVIDLSDWAGAGSWLQVVESIRLGFESVRSRLGNLLGQESAGTRSSWPIRAWRALKNWTNTHIGPLRHWLFSQPQFRGIWRLHIPIYLRVAVLRKAIRYAGAHNVISFCGSTNIAAILACQGESNHLVISERNDPARQVLRFPWNSMRPHYYGDADVVTANTMGALEAMRAYVPSERLALVHNPLEVQAPQRHRDKPKLQGPRLLMVGRLHPQKNHRVLLEAMAKLPEKLAGWRLSIVGQGDIESDLKGLAEILGVAERIDWHGQVEDPYPFYEASTVFVLPSIHEGSPNALIEAMSCGLPAIVSDASPGPLELVEDGKNGLVFPVSDAGALAGAIERLACSEELRERFRANGLTRLKQHELQAVLAQWEELLDPIP